MNDKLLAFEYIKDLCASDFNFYNVYEACEKVASSKFYRHEGYLFRENKLYIPHYSMHELLVREAHGVGLMGHFSIKKTLDMLSEYFFFATFAKRYWTYYARCVKCKQAKSKNMPHRLYMPLDVPNEP